MEELRYKYKIVDLGWVNDPELTKAAYQATDFFLMPSTQEAFGMMAMEAMAFGKPVVVFEGTSLPEVVGGPEIGIVIRQSVAELAQAIQHLIDHPETRKERGAKARDFAVKNYDLQLHLDRLLQVYQKTIEKHDHKAQ
jgi:glycosyltransferase involved in cell wall biosynthesis